MYVEYIVTSDEPLHVVQDIIRSTIVEVEDERDKGEERCCLQHLVSQDPEGELRLALYEVTFNWQPGRFYEQLLKEKLLEEGCELKLATHAV